MLRKLLNQAVVSAAFAAIFLVSCSPADAKSSSSDYSGTVPEDPVTAADLDTYNTVLLPKAEALCQSYFKAGDYSFYLTITPGGRKNRNYLTVDAWRRGGGSHTQLSFYYQDDLSSYHCLDPNAQAENASFLLSFLEDGSLTIDGPSEAAGTYYPSSCLLVSDAFHRPLNDAYLIGLSGEDIRILRNQFYAVYGRTFRDQTLQAYFDSQPWYIGSCDGEDFDLSVLSEMEKRNIRFLLETEEELDEEEHEKTRNAYETLTEAPYLSLLEWKGETLVELFSSPGLTKDMGIYYEAQGRISLPVTVTPADYETVMKESGEAEICINDQTGQTALMKYSDNYKKGDCMLLYEQEGEMVTSYFFLSYSADANLYTLWRDSADTFFKPAYEGTIFVLKGAAEEFLYGAIFSEEDAGREMAFDDPDIFSYMGNSPVFDEKGYLKALYYIGD